MRRTLKGTNQAEAQLTLVVTNNLPVQVTAGYLETMPWLLQFHLHTLHAHVKGVARGEFISLFTHDNASMPSSIVLARVDRAVVHVSALLVVQSRF